eukprot:Rhum_TRINITY_DN15217_c11_g1::Rhum_TRINITY_DN15217_c11_g1_i1::g.144756::m.144756
MPPGQQHKRNHPKGPHVAPGAVPGRRRLPHDRRVRHLGHLGQDAAPVALQKQEEQLWGRVPLVADQPLHTLQRARTVRDGGGAAQAADGDARREVRHDRVLAQRVRDAFLPQRRQAGVGAVVLAARRYRGVHRRVGGEGRRLRRLVCFGKLALRLFQQRKLVPLQRALQEQVGGVEVAVADALPVQVRQARQRVRHKAHHRSLRVDLEPARLAAQHRSAAAHLHHRHAAVVGDERVAEPDDVRVVHEPHGLHLARRRGPLPVRRLAAPRDAHRHVARRLRREAEHGAREGQRRARLRRRRAPHVAVRACGRGRHAALDAVLRGEAGVPVAPALRGPGGALDHPRLQLLLLHTLPRRREPPRRRLQRRRQVGALAAGRAACGAAVLGGGLVAVRGGCGDTGGTGRVRVIVVARTLSHSGRWCRCGGKAQARTLLAAKPSLTT